MLNIREIKIAFICLTFLLESSISYAQDLRNYTPKIITDQNGLPSSEVYDIVEDQKGFIWFATDRGVSRYNGVNHEVYNSRNGLKGNAAYHLFKQADTSIVCVNNEGVFYKIKNGIVSELIPEDSIKKYIKKIEFPFSFRQTQDGIFHIGTRSNYYKFDFHGNKICVEEKQVLNTLHVTYKEQQMDVFCYYYRPSVMKLAENIRVLLNGSFVKNFPVSNHYNHRSFYPSVNKGSIAIPFEYSFLLVKEGKLIIEQKVESRILSTHITDDQIFICAENGLYVYKYSENSIEFCYHLLEGLSISSALKTSNGNVWVSTIENGVRYFDLSEPQIILSASDNINFSAFEYDKGKVITGTYRGYISSGNHSFQSKNKRKVHSIQHVKENIYLLDGYVYNSLFNIKDGIPFGRNSGEILAGWYLIEIDSGTLLSYAGMGMMLFDSHSGKILEFVEVTKGIDDVAYLNKQIYVASNNQLIIYSVLPVGLKETDRVQVENIFKLFIYKGALCGITSDYRLFRFLNNKKVQWLNLPKPRDFSLITAIIASENMVHIGTNKGIYSWNPSEEWDDAELLGFENIPNPISIKIIPDTLLFSTKKKVFRKALNDIQIELPGIESQRVFIDGEKFPKNGVIRIAYNHQSIEIPLEFTNYTSNPIIFRYIVQNLNNDFVFTSDPTIRINSLPPGKYRIEVSATIDEVNYTPIQTIKLFVEAPYWKKWPFISGMIIITLLLLVLIYKIRVNQLKKKHLLQESITKLKAQALGSQLNPHMIFNVLNSIQGLVSEGEIEEANVYIARFSKFIRKSIHYMEVTQIPLIEEIEITKQYIEIEKLRFGDEVSFNIEEPSDSIVDLKVPPLIIQPIIENAIKHGLMPSKQERKELNVRIIQNGKARIIEVEDNGIGFKENYRYSIGMSVTESRIKLLNANNQLIVKQIKNPTIVQILLVYDN